MRSRSYRINIEPIAWRRPSHKESREYNDTVSFGLHLSKQHNEEPLFMDPVHLDVTFFVPQARTLKDRHKSNHPITTPYIDNLYHFLLYALKDVVIIDERVICSLSMKKVYDKEPRTEIVITEMG